jgi:hypothetical protein
MAVYIMHKCAGAYIKRFPLMNRVGLLGPIFKVKS